MAKEILQASLTESMKSWNDQFQKGNIDSNELNRLKNKMKSVITVCGLPLEVYDEIIESSKGA